MKKLFAILLLLTFCICVIAAGRRSAAVGSARLITDWSARVVANGGAEPSPNTIACMETLRATLESLGYTNRIYTLCVFVPDSIIAATTPLIRNKGADPWTNNNFVSGDLNIYGLKGDGSTKSLDSGLQGKNNQGYTNSTHSVGQTVIVTEAEFNRNAVVCGYSDATNTPRTILTVSLDGVTVWYPSAAVLATQIAQTNDFGRAGFVSGSQMVEGGTTNAKIYVASPTENFKLLVSNDTGRAVAATTTDNTISVFALKYAGTNALWSSSRLSVAMLHAGFTQTETSNIWVALRTCRECLGGGDGNQVHDWDSKVVAFGGAATSANTQNTLSNFLLNLDNNSLLYKMSALNLMVTDSVVAATVPIVWQAGNPIWTNINFGTTNLSANGLQGNASNKYLQTGISPTNINRGFSDNSAGISLLMWDNPDTAGNGLFCQGGATATHQFGMFSFGGAGLYRCWATTLVNQNFVRASVSPQTNGWISGQRTANNAIALYKARGDQAHTLVTNATGTLTITADPPGLTLYALNSNGSIFFYSAPTISFAGVSSGLTQAQTSNLYTIVTIARTNLGGGVP